MIPQGSSSRKRNRGEEKSFHKKVRQAKVDGKPVRVNRHGIVPPHSTSDKPIFTLSELHQNRKRRLSFESIGKKLGIDPCREDVVTLSKIMRDGELTSS